MKKITWLILLVLCSLTTFAQTAIPKGANKILVANTKTAADNFLFAKRILAEKGVEILNQDKDVLQIRSGNVLVKGTSAYYVIIYCKDQQLQVVGMASSDAGFKEPYQRIENKLF